MIILWIKGSKRVPSRQVLTTTTTTTSRCGGAKWGFEF